jgi:hypothetical protein
LCSSLVEITVAEGGRRGAVHAGVVEDVSASGLGILMDGALHERQRVFITGGDISFEATVRYCRDLEAGAYRIGVEFASEYLWSEDGVWPEHTLDVPADVAVSPAGA